MRKNASFLFYLLTLPLTLPRGTRTHDLRRRQVAGQNRHGGGSREQRGSAVLLGRRGALQRRCALCLPG